ncbi:hypothetical protein [Candidatus Rhabdochlamydia sp. T3358]|uniref:hypothetical protein n=1 Tax=Candidatus Rhabdochlamydia sp. T3358 TaxID=2099795 RepID=UPI0010B26CA0|nr:hypothetical protein [Candidatus Rhabdochlamydia sp. T3358]VHN99512.1 hypothetical protein RHT_00027 [Candidatus Rhabdochlamydia sp. T3358]
MKAVTNGNRIEITGLNNNELNFDLSEALNLKGGTVERLEIFYVDKRVIQQKKTIWETFTQSFTTSIGWSAGAAVVSAIGVVFFNIIKAKRENS